MMTKLGRLIIYRNPLGRLWFGWITPKDGTVTWHRQKEWLVK